MQEAMAMVVVVVVVGSSTAPVCASPSPSPSPCLCLFVSRVRLRMAAMKEGCKKICTDAFSVLSRIPRTKSHSRFQRFFLLSAQLLFLKRTHVATST